METKSLQFITLSALIRRACEDARVIMKTPGYTMNLDMWHEPLVVEGGEPTCFVCLAGSVMARTLGASWAANLTPSDFDTETCQMLRMVNLLRVGNLQAALRCFDGMDEDWLEEHRQLLEPLERWAQDPPPRIKELLKELRILSLQGGDPARVIPTLEALEALAGELNEYEKAWL